MQKYQIDFVKFLVEAEALKFGSFELKSGRVAPYFLNAGCFYTGEFISKLGEFYAEALLASGLQADIIYGPAYKGIPLSVATVNALFVNHSKNLAYTFNRKEAKTHGASKGKVLVGAPLLEGSNVVLVDDVITAGTAIRESVEVLKNNGNPKLNGVLIALNRMEKNNDGENAIVKPEDSLGVKVHAIVDLDDVIEVLYNKEVNGRVYIDDEKMKMIADYRDQYGV